MVRSKSSISLFISSSKKVPSHSNLYPDRFSSLLENLFNVEELTNSQDIIVSEKIKYHKIYKLGNLIFGIFMVKDGSVFSYKESLMTFPFKSKTEYRGFMNNNKLSTFMIFKNETTLYYMIPNDIEISNQIIGNFYFVI